MRTSAAAAETIAELRAVWEEIGPGSCPFHYNFHMHTTCSDGRLTPQQLLHQARDIGLQGLAITDHHTLAGYHQVSRSSSRGDLKVWTGIEINAFLLDCEVHILGYGFDPHHSRLTPYLQRQTTEGRDYIATAVIDAIHAAGGLAVLAHPFRYRSPGGRLIQAAHAAGIDGIEAYYSYSNPFPWAPSPRQTQKAVDMAKQFDLYTTCGTDTHGTSLLQRI